KADLFQNVAGLLQHGIGMLKIALLHGSFSLVDQRVRQVMTLSLEVTEKADGLTGKLIRLAGAVQTQQAQTGLLGNFCRLEMHVMLLKDGAAARKEQQCLAVVALCGINLGDVEFLTCYGDLLLLMGGKAS